MLLLLYVPTTLVPQQYPQIHTKGTPAPHQLISLFLFNLVVFSYSVNMEHSSWCVGSKFVAKENCVEVTQDLLPGEIVFVQSKPVMFIPVLDTTRGYHDVRLSLLFVAYELFITKLTKAEQSSFLTLRVSYATTTEIQNLASAVLIEDQTTKCKRPLNVDELNVFVKVASIVRSNVFALSDGFAIFDSQPLARIAHSCIPNCSVEIVNHVCTCRVIRPVRAGEKLTIEYSARCRLLPIHLRRQYYLEKKGFTCHCPRCIGPCDDTRQFQCTDLMCTGSHNMCQPLNQNEVCSGSGFYSRVDYVPPHLLPCTVCHSTAPLEYQELMLMREAWLPEAVAEISALGRQVLESRDYQLSVTVLLKVATVVQFHSQHSLCLEALRVGYQMWMVQVFLSGPTYLPKLYRAVDNFVSALALHTHFPNDQVVNVLVDLVRDLVHLPTKLSVAKAHACCMHALRLHLILHGRDCHSRAVLDQLLIAILEMSTMTLPMPTHSPVPPSVSLPVVQDEPHSTSSSSSTSFAFLPSALLDISFTSVSSTPVSASYPCAPVNPAAGRTLLVCLFCGESGTRAVCKKKCCAHCKTATYCSVSCQKAHWRVHKNGCEGYGK